MRCYFAWDEETKQKILIPWCYGSMHQEDLSCCTCAKPNKSQKQFEKEEYNKKVNELNEELEHLRKEYNVLLKIIEKINLKSNIMSTSEENEISPYTWAKLKEFCNSLTEDQLSQTVRVIREDDSIEILDASEIGADHYKFDDEEYSFSKDDFDPEYHLEGKYATFEKAIANEEYRVTPKTNVYLYERF